jgi:hypothetical protein
MGWKQKTTEFIKVNNVDVNGWNAATAFTSDAIEFPESIPWALVLGDDSITHGGTPAQITVEASAANDNDWVEYKSGSTGVDINVSSNKCVLDDTFPPRYFRVVYTPGTATGTFTLRISK